MRTIIVLAILSCIALTTIEAALPVRSHPHRIGNEQLLEKLSTYQIVQPKLKKTTHFKSESVQENTGNEQTTLYPNSLTVDVNAFGRVYEVELTRNSQLLSADYDQIRIGFAGEDSNTTVAKGVDCFYHGNVKGDASSVVALSTCEGLSGFISASGEFFGIEPATVTTRHPTSLSAGKSRRHLPLKLASTHEQQASYLTASHIIYRMSDYTRMDQDEHCGVEAKETQISTSGTEAPADTQSTETPVAPTAAVPEQQPIKADAEFGANSNVQYIELLVVNDKERYALHGDRVEHDTLEIVNMVSEMYKRASFQTPIRVVLVGQVTLAQEPYQIPKAQDGRVETQGEDGLLGRFNNWKLTVKHRLKPSDTVQLFSGLTFAHGILGLANVQMMCNEQYSGTVTTLKEPSLVQNAIIAAHETGHTLNMYHDGSNNECPNKGYVMASIAGVGADFSSCSIRAVNTFLNSQPQCLTNVPRT
jgi:hypothetical protein